MRKCACLMIGLTAIFTGCSGGSDCTPHEGKYCQEGATYWMDSCGNLEDVFETCQCGCEDDHSACETECGCIPQCSGRCCGSDQCGSTCPDNCASTGQTCNTTTCLCEGACQPKTCAQLGKQCGWWDDGCGTDIPCGTCSGGQTCNADGQCVGGTVSPAREGAPCAATSAWTPKTTPATAAPATTPAPPGRSARTRSA